jgi:hypothetical protein
LFADDFANVSLGDFQLKDCRMPPTDFRYGHLLRLIHQGLRNTFKHLFHFATSARLNLANPSSLVAINSDVRDEGGKRLVIVISTDATLFVTHFAYSRFVPECVCFAL